jgi:hypothetical protein
LSPPLDAAPVADPDSHSQLIPGPLDALARFQASFSDALRGELHRRTAMRAGGRRQCCHRSEDSEAREREMEISTSSPNYPERRSALDQRAVT